MKNKMKNKMKEKITQQNSIKEPKKDIEIQKKEREVEDYIKTSEFLDKFPNKNLFKNDAKYSLNYLLDFKFEEDDIDFKYLIVSIFYKNQTSCVILLYFRFFLYYITNYLIGNNYEKKNIYIHLVSLIISVLIMFNKSKFVKIYTRIIVKVVLDINQCIFILSSFKNHQSDYLLDEFLFSGVANFMLNLHLKFILFSFSFLSICFLFVNKNFNIYIYVILVLIQLIVSISFVYLCKRGVRYLWTLYDSFKRSYLVFNEIMENEFGPIFIVSQNMDILYSNNAAKEFDEFIHKSSINSDLKKKIGTKRETNFQKMIIPTLYPLFNKLLEDTLNHKTITHFYFPFPSINENLNNIGYKSYLNFFLLSGNYEKLNWYNVMCSKCIWKVYNSIFINLIPCHDYDKNDICSNNIKFFLNKLDENIENANKMCEIILRCERNSLLSASVPGKSIRRLGIYMKNSKSRRESVLSFTNDIGLIFPNMDYSILFFFKNQSEILYDLLQTQHLYVNFFSNSKKIEMENFVKKNVNLEIFTNYFIFYFDPLLTSKYYTIDFKMKENCKYIIIEEKLLRITLFNVLLFILSNTKSNDNTKNIICSVKLIKETSFQNKNVEKSPNDYLKKKRVSTTKKSKNYYTLYFDICITGDSSIDYNKVNSLLHYDYLNEDYLNIEKLKHSYLNLGIITAYHIVTKYFKKEFVMNSSEKGSTVLFGLKCEKESKYSNNEDFEEDDDSYCFYKENFYFYNIYYHEKLIKNIYNLEPMLPNYNYNRLFLKLEKSDNNSLGRSSDYESENENKNSSHNSINNFNNNKNSQSINNKNMNHKKSSKRKIMHIKKNSINKVKSELRSCDQDIINKNSVFSSFTVENLKSD